MGSSCGSIPAHYGQSSGLPIFAAKEPEESPDDSKVRGHVTRLVDDLETELPIEGNKPRAAGQPERGFFTFQDPQNQTASDPKVT